MHVTWIVIVVMIVNIYVIVLGSALGGWLSHSNGYKVLYKIDWIEV